MQDQQKALKEIQSFITSIQHKHELTTAYKIQDYKRRHMQLAARVLRVYYPFILDCVEYAKNLST